MSLRTFFFLILSVLVVIVCTCVWLALPFVESAILGLFAPSLVDSLTPVVHLLLLEQMVGVVLLILLFSITLFFVFSSSVVAPLRRLVDALNAYTKDGTKVELPDSTGAGKEILQLTADFAALAERVESTQQKDADVTLVKADFISTAAHQLRTPLTGIRWALEALQKENLTDSQQTLVAGAVDKSHELVTIVGTLLDISSLDSGKYEYKFTAGDVSAIIPDVIKEFSPLAQAKGVSLFYVKDGEALPPVRFDTERIALVLKTLVENGIRYTPSPGTVRVMADASSGYVYLRVIDTGIGIPEKERGNIFKRFYRAGNATSKETQGNGLSLSLARTIAIDHDGDLTFVPNPNGPGMTFVLTLPAVL